ncbi:hypothetical protein ABIA03_000088 [Bradyrhizobium yuanmingense]|uniref:Uncharacterized protein n=1 Tax=Bradyrhizobium yuanmingense TaxID=108015 RepID=A0ABV4G7D7_9BRAD
MHQHSADRVMAPTAILVPAAVDALGQADSARVRALVGEFRGVLNEENWACTIIVTRACGGEVAAKDVGFLHALVGEEAVGRLRVRPVLARERYASAHAVTNLLQQLAKSLTKTGILESCLIDLALCPVFDDAFIAIILATFRAGRPTRRRSARTHQGTSSSRFRCSTMNHKRFIRFKIFRLGLLQSNQAFVGN